MAIARDPFNLVISGVGGQGNVLMSHLIGGALLKKGYLVTMADDIGVSQRAGAVTSSIRISQKKSYGPMIPDGHAHFILGLEPLETLRMLNKYGNPKVLTLTNFQPIFPTSVLNRQHEYPDCNELREAIKDLSQTAWFVDATQIALNLGAVIMANVVMIGASLRTGQLPLTMSDIGHEIKDSFPLERTQLNLEALEIGFNAMK